MNNIIITGFIEDAHSEKCSDVEVVKLSQIFAEAVIPFARHWKGKSICEKVYYDNLVGFEEAKEVNLEEFDLTIEKTDSNADFDHFKGTFICDNKNLKILAKIKKN